MPKSRWRVYSRRTIRDVLTSHQLMGKEQLIKLIKESYPFGERKYTPYQIWLEEVKIVEFFLTLDQPHKWYFDWANQFKGYKDLATANRSKHIYVDPVLSPSQLTLF